MCFSLAGCIGVSRLFANTQCGSARPAYLRSSRRRSLRMASDVAEECCSVRTNSDLGMDADAPRTASFSMSNNAEERKEENKTSVEYKQQR